MFCHFAPKFGVNTLWGINPVFAHNLETVPRLMKTIRPAFRYDRFLSVTNAAKQVGLVTKSNLILGMGETTEKIESTMRDLLDA
ncbi:MAG: hypothetical protein E6063_07225 [Atopobium sp.]|nr:hypothetical protein [Atopobium sp.]